MAEEDCLDATKNTGSVRKSKRRKTSREVADRNHEAEEEDEQEAVVDIEPYKKPKKKKRKRSDAALPPGDQPTASSDHEEALEVEDKADTASPATAKTEGIGPASGQPVLPWMQVPIEVETSGGVPVGDVRGLDPALQTALVKEGFEELYPVQATTWTLLAGGFSDAHDLCICVPTGSGKTLAYTLPILQGLTGRARDSLGALVVLPTRELALQVWTVFGPLVPAVGLWTGLAAGRRALAGEAQAFRERMPNILVATPGRLMAHLSTDKPTFSLSSLRFLVVDETDRLLRQGYQQWLPHVIKATSSPPAVGGRPLPGSRVVKIIVSATLTQDPAKIARLHLHAPRYISLSSSRRYKVPRQLKEFKVTCAAADKPLVLIALLQHLQVSRAVVFTGSLVATHRLCTLLRCFPGMETAAVEHSSRAAGRKGESEGLAAFRSGSARVLVASDALTRGMDIPDVDVVINYDPAVYPKTYVHRAGRTARAGRTGSVISLLTSEQVRHFKALLRKVDNTYVKDFTLPAKLVKSLRPEFLTAIEKAGELEKADA